MRRMSVPRNFGMWVVMKEAEKAEMTFLELSFVGNVNVALTDGRANSMRGERSRLAMLIATQVQI